MGRRKKLWKLFLSTLYISAFTFGGGFVIVTFMKRKFVDELHWTDEVEMLDMTALAQSSPSSISVNAAILMGWRVCGFAGMLVAVLGTILQLVAFGGAEMRMDNLNWLALGLFAAALVILRWKRWNPILVMVLCGVVYLTVHLLPGIA